MLKLIDSFISELPKTQAMPVDNVLDMLLDLRQATVVHSDHAPSLC